MSMPCEKTVSCPKCGAPIRFTMWRSINTEIKTALQDIISGKLFDVQCGACGCKTFVNYPILFNDMINWVMIDYVFPEDRDLAAKSVQEQFVDKGVRARVVVSQEELREKAAIFNAGLDDRIVELLKVLVLKSWEPHLAGKKIDHVFYFDLDGSPAIRFSLDGEAAFSDLGTERYGIVADMAKERLSGMKEVCVVDRDWAIAFLRDRNTAEKG